MTLELLREHCTPDRCEGRFSIDGVFLGYSLEPPRRSENSTIQHPAIPSGTYDVVIGWSPRFQRQVPHINNVPGRSNIEIHPGNSVADTLGCILVGKQRSGVSIWHSADAVHELMAELVRARVKQEPVTLTIEDLVGEGTKIA